MFSSVLSTQTPAQTQWNKLLTNPVLPTGPPGSWDENTAVADTVRKHEGIYKRWYEGDDSFGYATSPDGIYHMWYTGWNTAGDYRIGYATSPNGIIWTKYAGNPVLAPGTSGAWDDELVALPFVASVDSLVMYYGGFYGASFRTGYAGTVSSLVPTLLRSYAAAWNGSGIEISWTLSEAGTDIRSFILRSEPSGSRYEELDAAGLVRNGMSFGFADGTAPPGASYRYAVQVADEDCRRLLFETDAVTVPALPLAIERVTMKKAVLGK